MKTFILQQPLLFILSGLMASASAQAHHSTSGFNTEEVVAIEGTVTQFRWTNPHASIKIDVADTGEAADIWTIELTAPNVLVNQGWKRTSLRNGDKVTVYGNPMNNPDFRLRDGSQGALYVGVTLADGSNLGRVDGKGEGSDQ